MKYKIIMGGEIINISSRDTFNIYIKEHRYNIVKVSAAWCGPCQKIKPWFMDRFKTMPENVNLILVDVDEGDLSAFLKVKTIPHIQNVIEELAYEIYPTSDPETLEKFFQITEQRSKI
jgi:thioredoxin-like negative regulator of GroEL